MNASFEQPPSSPSELAAGAVALGVVALITIFGVSTSPPGAVSPSVASAAPPRTVAREPDNGLAEPAKPSQAIQLTQPSQPNQNGTTPEIPIVTPPPTISEPPPAVSELAPPASETPNRSKTADSRSIEESSPVSSSEPDTDSLRTSRAQALDILRVDGARPAQHQSRATETPAPPRVEAFIGIWAREPAECRSRATDDERIRIDARSAQSGGVRCAFRSVRQEGAERWRVHAFCNSALDSQRDSWNANISLRMNGPNLRWSSERGTETYVRCPSPAGPLRQAGTAR